MSFLDELRAGAARCGLPSRRVLIAVSGGPDSMALLCGLLRLRDELDITLQAAHLNHCLRGDTADADAAWLRAECARLDVPLHTETAAVGDLATREGTGIEETARRVRYKFLQQAARKHACSHIVVAHTADDQAETILHHILRGTGIEGLRGVPASRPLANDIVIARPLLDVGRAQVMHFLEEIGQESRSDAMNLDERFTRSRIRHTLLPLLREEFNPQVDSALRRLGQQAGEVQHMLDVLAARLLEEATVDRQPTVCRLDCTGLADQPRQLVRECFTRLWKNLDWPRKQMGFGEWDRLAELTISSGTVTLPGNIEARRRGDLLVLRRL